MGHTPFGYRIENGKAVIDNKATEQIRILFHSYLSGDSLDIAAYYLGDEYYPQLLTQKLLRLPKWNA